MKEIKAIIRSAMLQKVLDALTKVDGLPGVTLSEVIGWGKGRAKGADEPVKESGHAFAKKMKLEIVVSDSLAHEIEAAIATAAQTGRPGDGKVFVYDVRRVLKIRTGETDDRAI